MEVEITAQPLTFLGRPAELVLVRDVTLRKREEDALRKAQESAEQAERIKRDLLNNMSHELRTPLNGILGMSGLLLEGEITLEQREFIELIKSSGDHLFAVIDDVLRLCATDPGTLGTEVVDFDLREAVSLAVRALAPEASQKKLALMVHVDDGVSQRMIGDPGILRQTLLILAGNAIKFTAEGRVEIQVQEDPAHPRAGVHFTVSDTGIGIPAEKQDTIFDAFTQADMSSTRTYGGLGIGLALADKLVRLMGGRIWVKSAPHSGSEFHFTAMFEMSQNTSASVVP
jgi:signal transduction histidine kinase